MTLTLHLLSIETHRQICETVPHLPIPVDLETATAPFPHLDQLPTVPSTLSLHPPPLLDNSSSTSLESVPSIFHERISKRFNAFGPLSIRHLLPRQKETSSVKSASAFNSVSSLNPTLLSLSNRTNRAQLTPTIHSFKLDSQSSWRVKLESVGITTPFSSAKLPIGTCIVNNSRIEVGKMLKR